MTQEQIKHINEILLTPVEAIKASDFTENKKRGEVRKSDMKPQTIGTDNASAFLGNIDDDELAGLLE